MKLAFNLVPYHIPIAHIGWSFKMTGLSHTCIADKLQCVCRLTSGLCSALWLLVYKAPDCFNYCKIRTNTFGNLKGLHSSFFYIIFQAIFIYLCFFSQINYRISCLVRRNRADSSDRISLNENLKFLQHWDFVSESM